MTKPKSLSRATDYLGDLGAKLRDLQGYTTLAYELIQNADDAPAGWMAFNLSRDALILDNDGVFTACEEVEAPQCPWLSTGEDGHRCDFHRFRLIGSGDKRLQEGTTGAFGIGFISVYQLTNEPELISAGRHWTLHDERSEDQRIDVCPGCLECNQPDLPGTRFILPFARDEQAFLRQALKAEPVPENVTERLLEELERSLPVAMIFLKNLKTIEVRHDRQRPLKFEREVDNGTLLISQGASPNDRIWHLIHGTFHEAAAEGRRNHPGRLEGKRSSEVVVALPTEAFSEGLLCACLPTEESPMLPFHVNADFFPSNNRKSVILGHDYQSHWNREALLAAARTVAEATPQLTTMLGAEHFWHVVDALRLLAGKDGNDRVWKSFWEALQIPLGTEAVIATSSGGWVKLECRVALLQHEDEAPCIPVLEGLGITVVSEVLRRYQTTLRSIGIPYFDVEALCSAIADLGLDKPIRIDDLPPCLVSRSARESLWTEIAILLERKTRTPHARNADRERLGVVSLAPTIEKALWPCQDAFRADEATVELFLSLGLDIPFLDQTQTAFEPLADLCPEFRIEDAVEALEDADPSTVQQLWMEDHFPIGRLIEWFATRREEIVNSEDIRDRLAALPIYPSTNGRLHSLTSLVLPGDFKDPFGLANFVAVDAIGRRREFLTDLGVDELDFRTFVLDYLPQALEDEDLNPAVKDAAVSLLAGRLGELKDDREAHEVLVGVPLVTCADGECRRADDCYFPDELVQEVLGKNANIVVLPVEREAAVQELFAWLGVERTPRSRDIVQTVRRIAGGPCESTSVLLVQQIIAHLARRFEGRARPAQLEALRDIKWLPARGDRGQWHLPESLYAPYQSYLFDSQAAVLDVPPTTNRGLLDFLGVHTILPPALVVRHLLYCAKSEHPVNTEVYRFLNDNADDRAIEQLRFKNCLWLGATYRSPEHVFWSDHPFGRYRWRLADNLRGYGDLLEKIGVTDMPDRKDAVEVLHEISLQFGEANRPLDDEAYAAMMSCWEMLEEALDAGKIPDEDFESLSTTKSIPNKSRVLYFPPLLYFENRAGLADKFEGFLEGHVIPRPLRTGRAFLGAGVRQLSSDVELELLRNDNPAHDPDTRSLLQQRSKEIARVLSSQMISHDVQNALEKLSRVECMSATSLELRYRLTAFDRIIKSQAESVPALYEQTSNSLWATRPNGQLPWTSLARELASALRSEEDPGLFAAGLKEVLAADTTAEAATVLDELGFSQLDTTIVEPPPSLEAAHNLGVESPTDGDDSSSHHGVDESPEVLTEDDERDHLTTEDALKALGITQAPTSPVPNPPETTSATGSEQGTTAGARPAGVPETDPAEALPGRHASSEHVSSPRGTRQTTQSGGSRKFVSYVSLSHEEEDEPDPDGLTQQERRDLEAHAIALILETEPQLRCTPTNNPGFDLFEQAPDSQPTRWVEVKAMKGTLNDRSVGLSRTQFQSAENHGQAFWLYIVENAGTRAQARVIRLQDPAGKSKTFTFDRGWLSVAEGSETFDK